MFISLDPRAKGPKATLPDRGCMAAIKDMPPLGWTRMVMEQLKRENEDDGADDDIWFGGEKGRMKMVYDLEKM